MLRSQKKSTRETPLLFLPLILLGLTQYILHSCRAQEVPQKAPDAGAVPAQPAFEQPTIASAFPVLGEFKRALLDQGYNLQFNYTGEVLGNPTGGTRQNVIYEGLLEMVLDGDLEKLAGMNGAAFHINAFLIHGQGLSTYTLYNYLTVSSIEAHRATRLSELWFEQKLFGDLATIRIGQLAVDNTSFFASEYGTLFINATFGWPNKSAADLPSGGPAYPLATPAIYFPRVGYKPSPLGGISL